MIVIVAFFVLLLLGIPISMVVLGASTLGVILYSGTPLQIVVQQMFSGLNNYVLLAIPFFIVSGTIASRCCLCIFCRYLRLLFCHHCGHWQHYAPLPKGAGISR